MVSFLGKKLVYWVLSLVALWITVRYCLPIALPFLLGAGVALAAEPGVRFLTGKLRLPRGLAVCTAVGLALALLVMLAVLVLALTMKGMGALVRVLPGLAETAGRSMALLEGWLLELAEKLPDGLGSAAVAAVSGLFSGGSALLGGLLEKVLGLAGSMLSSLADRLLSLGVGVLSAFLISARLPQLRKALPAAWKERILPKVRIVRDSVLGWLKAQLELMGISFAIVTGGLLLLRIPYAPVWAVGIALVDALPMLGTGTVLLPWALVSLLQQEPVRALGLVGIYVTSMLVRTTLEPRLLGKQLGLDPLLTLAAMYLGYRLWGIFGMLLSPMLAVAAVRLERADRKK